MLKGEKAEKTARAQEKKGVKYQNLGLYSIVTRVGTQDKLNLQSKGIYRERDNNDSGSTPPLFGRIFSVNVVLLF